MEQELLFHQQTIIEKFFETCEKYPHQKLYTYLDDYGQEQEQLTYYETLLAQNAIAKFLSEECQLLPGDRVLLVYTPSLDFVIAVIACLVTGLVPVPICPPDPIRIKNDITSFNEIVKSCNPKAILTNKQYEHVRIALTNNVDIQWPNLPWYITNELTTCEEIIGFHKAKLDDIAFIQYTSGSTSTPKGVIIKHCNVMHQLTANARDLNLDRFSRSVLWIPHYHDFCLISGILSAIAGNGHLYLMSSLSFLKNPAIWFDVLSRVHATHTAAPNFAYELVLHKTTFEKRQQWDLSKLEVLMSAAEPIRHKTMQRFFDAFSITGLRPETFCPAYGLAEHTVGVTVNGKNRVELSRRHLEQFNKVKLLTLQDTVKDDLSIIIGCGSPAEDTIIRIVNPETNQALPEGHVGEIWVDSPSKAAGYWGDEEITKTTFHAKLIGDSYHEFLRTGDLGFVLDNELYITGRLKELIILNGRNIYPQDLELTVSHCHANINPQGIVGFILPQFETEQFVILVELTTDVLIDKQFEVIADTIFAAIMEQHGVTCHTIWLGRLNTLPRTPSGKLQRTLCRTLFAANQCQNGMLYVKNYGMGNSNKPLSQSLSLPEIDEQQLKNTKHYLAQVISELLDISINEIIDDKNLSHYGFDSVSFLQLATTLEEQYNHNFTPALFFEHRTITQLAYYLLSLSNTQREISESISTHLLLQKAVQHENIARELNPIYTNILASYSQKRLYHVTQKIPCNLVYNLPFAIEIRDELELNRFKMAYNLLINRHESLRTSFKRIENNLFQIIANEGLMDLEVIETDKIETIIPKFINKIFDLHQSPLVHAQLVVISKNLTYFLVNFHHTIVDGASVFIFFEELAALYQGKTLPPAIQYREFSEWQNNSLKQLRFSEHEHFWLKKLENFTLLNLPTDFQRPALQSFTGSRHQFILNKETTRQIKLLAHQEQTTIYTVLLSIFFITLQKFTGQKDILLGTTHMGRTRKKFSNLIGVCINLLALREKLNDGNTYLTFLTQLKLNTLEAFKHADYPFMKLIEILHIEENLDRSLLIDVTFNLMNIPRPKIQSFNAKQYSLPHSTSKRDLSLEGWEEDETIILEIEYATSLFKKTTIQAFAEQFKLVISNVLEKPEIELKMIPNILKREEGKACHADELVQ